MNPLGLDMGDKTPNHRALMCDLCGWRRNLHIVEHTHPLCSDWIVCIGCVPNAIKYTIDEQEAFS